MLPFFLFSHGVPITACDVLSLVMIGGSFSRFIEQHSYNKPFGLASSVRFSLRKKRLSHTESTFVHTLKCVL